MILIDPREGSGDLITLPPLSLCTECGAESEITYLSSPPSLSNCSRSCPFDPDHSLISELYPMQFGDVSFHGYNHTGRVSIGIEVKSTREFTNAIDTGRLADIQLRGMLDTYTVSILAIYGRSRPGPNNELELDREESPGTFRTYRMGDRGIPAHSALDSFLFSPQIYDAGILPVRLESKSSLALWLHTLHTSWTRSYDSHKSLKVFYRPELPELSSADSSLAANILTLPPAVRDAAHMLSGLPGVRYSRGIAAALHFGTIYAACRADIADWADVQVNGRAIGTKAAKRIVDYIRRECRSNRGKK